ncbi:PREDICTED: autophagy-related protein 16-1-like isoform X2 [Nicrophorus vespilloides]|uniref:Autophagy-related protein 16-1-like isoform X2 n=1 Tax=Nicrophorus vespilloides TaxID=110193 RepID=A0ABM1M7X8_NICVS|nr:PREDICTED: autophagy-related protein 16-1-like isoform X2 [Nicrophorus vespilloides]
MAKLEETNWRKCIIEQIQDRNRNQTRYFHDIITQNNRLFENANALRSENLQLSIQNEKLKADTGSQPISNASGDSKLTERIQFLEQKVLVQQEELTELHRRKGENAQQIIDLNVKLQEREKVLALKETSLEEALSSNSVLKVEIRMHESNMKEMENLTQMLRDEHQALQLAFNLLEDKLRKVQDENRQLVERLISYKAKDAQKMNEDNDNFLNRAPKQHSALTLSTFGLFRYVS